MFIGVDRDILSWKLIELIDKKHLLYLIPDSRRKLNLDGGRCVS